MYETEPLVGDLKSEMCCNCLESFATDDMIVTADKNGQHESWCINCFCYELEDNIIIGSSKIEYAGTDDDGNYIIKICK